MRTKSPNYARMAFYSLDYYKDQGKLLPDLPKEEQLRLGWLVFNGARDAKGRLIDALAREARDTLILANVRIVIPLALKYRTVGVDMDEVYCVGQIGLFQAVDRYEPARGVKFSSYATWWVRARLQHWFETRFQWGRCGTTMKEIPESDLAMSTEFYVGSNGESFRKTAKGTPTQIRLDHRTPSPEYTAEDNDHRNLLREFIGRLHPRDATVIRARYGLDGAPRKTLVETGKAIGVTKERARQIEVRALAHLKHFAKQKSLGHPAS